MKKSKKIVEVIEVSDERKSKRLELTPRCIKAIGKIAIDEETVFKLKAEQILEDFAKENTYKDGRIKKRK